MYLAEGGEPFLIVTTKEEVDALVGVKPQELADDLYGEHFGVGELGCGSAASDAPLLELVVDKAEDSYDEGAKIHKKKTSFCSRWIGAPPRVGRSSLWLKFSKKLAHGVS
jgi:hypothetical protein